MHRAATLALTLAVLPACFDKGSDSAGDQWVAPGDHAQGFEVGDEPLDFTLPSADGETVNLSDYAGQRIIVVGTSGW